MGILEITSENQVLARCLAHSNCSVSGGHCCYSGRHTRPPQVWAGLGMQGGVGTGHCHTVRVQRPSPWHRVDPNRPLPQASTARSPRPLSFLPWRAAGAEGGACGGGGGEVGEVVPGLQHPRQGPSATSLGPGFPICAKREDSWVPTQSALPGFQSLGCWACCVGDSRGGRASCWRGPRRGALGESGPPLWGASP